MRLLTIAGLLSLVLAARGAAAGDPPPRLVVHEWGTFTVLQDEDGREIGGINVDDEPLPDFVHDASGGNDGLHAPLVDGPSRFLRQFTKGAIPRLHPDVTMRLETPVLYFHLPKGADEARVDVDVRFKGGWLTQFFPDAKWSAPGLKPLDPEQPAARLAPDTVGTLAWKGVRVGGEAAPFPETQSGVWLAPRKVDAAPVTVGSEGERYLFYRGVG